MDLDQCHRCNSKIVAQRHYGRPELFPVMRTPNHEEFETKEVLLCSTCRDELWDWVEPEGSPDRSNMADPIPLELLKDGVEGHRDELDGLLDELDSVATE